MVKSERGLLLDLGLECCEQKVEKYVKKIKKRSPIKKNLELDLCKGCSNEGEKFKSECVINRKSPYPGLKKDSLDLQKGCDLDHHNH